jgi:hypothetical protein
MNAFTKAELEALRILEDPVLWIEATTGEKPRWYQVEILHDPSIRKVARMGRRCMVPGTPILMADGSWKPIEQIKVGEYVMSRNNKNQLVRKRVTLEHDNGVKDVYRIRLSNGLHIDCTSNHPLLIQDQWKSIDDGLSIGDLATTLDGNTLIQTSIISIEPIGRSPTYDIGVEDTHNFVANGIVCHNTGKCLAEFSNLNTEAGYIQAKDLYSLTTKPKILTYDEANETTFYTSDYLIWSNGVKPVFKIMTNNGRATYATENHPFLVYDNEGYIWKELGDIDLGEKIRTLHSLEEVFGIYYVGDYETYDLTVPQTHTLVSDDIISHNTWTMCAHMLWYAFTHNDASLVVATPYESQITVIFDQLRKFIANAPELQSSIAYDRRNPQEIKFHNRSAIRGFTAGTRSGAAGGSLRGQKADWLYLDELDYMTDADFDTIFAIALEAPKRIGVWCSSTPTGRRATFYRLCTDKRAGWTEFYYPSMVNPEWDETMEKELRAMFSTEVAWQHEVLAEFGEETIGVFKKEFIDRAKADYRYIKSSTNKNIRVAGVDWDLKVA